MSDTASDTADVTDYERIGGARAVSAVVASFYEKVLNDPDLASYFEGVDMTALRRHQALLISQVLGGPTEYDGRELSQAHASLHVTGEAFDRVVEHLVASLQEGGVGDDVIGRLGGTLGATRGDIVTA